IGASVSLPEGQKITSKAKFSSIYVETPQPCEPSNTERSPSPSPPRTQAGMPVLQGTERGVSNREGDTNISASRLSARNRFLLHCHVKKIFLRVVTGEFPGTPF